MIMDQFDVYRYYLALRLHFTTDNYDVIKSKGRVKASRQAFAKRKDLYAITKIAKTYSDEEVANFLIANFVSGDRWGGVFDSEAKNRYLDWKKRIESLQYLFTKDLDFMEMQLELQNKNLNDIFCLTKNEHPYIIKEYLRKAISIETLVILDKLTNFTSNFDSNIDDTIVWPEISRLIKKYKPFVKIDRDKYNGIFRRRIGHLSSEN